MLPTADESIALDLAGASNIVRLRVGKDARQQTGLSLPRYLKPGTLRQGPGTHSGQDRMIGPGY